MAFWLKSINMTIQQTAIILKVGFIMRYFDKAVIQQWAGNKIIKGNDNISFIELALIESKSNSEVIALITSIVGEAAFECNQILDAYYLGFFIESLYSVNPLNYYHYIHCKTLPNIYPTKFQ